MNFVLSPSAKLFWTRVFAVTTAVSLLFGSGLFINNASASTELFADDFEGETFDAWDSVDGGWSIEDPDGAESTTYYAKVVGVSDDGNIPQDLVAEFSSEGYENLVLRFFYQMQGMDDEDSVVVQWSGDGDEWSFVEGGEFEGADGSEDDSDGWQVAELELSSFASDQEELYIRFRSSMNVSGDMFLLDQVNVRGDEIYDGLFFDLVGRKFLDEPGDGEHEFEGGLRRWLISLYQLNDEGEYEEHSHASTNRRGSYEIPEVKEGE